MLNDVIFSYLSKYYIINKEMQAIQLAVMQQLIKLLAPTSPAYGNSTQPFYVKEKD